MTTTCLIGLALKAAGRACPPSDDDGRAAAQPRRAAVTTTADPTAVQLLGTRPLFATGAGSPKPFAAYARQTTASDAAVAAAGGASLARPPGEDHSFGEAWCKADHEGDGRASCPGHRLDRCDSAPGDTELPAASTFAPRR